VGPRRPLDLVKRLGTLQLEAVNVAERTHFIVPSSRLGGDDPKVLTRRNSVIHTQAKSTGVPKGLKPATST